MALTALTDPRALLPLQIFRLLCESLSHALCRNAGIEERAGKVRLRWDGHGAGTQ
jgi:hypothetical protein